MFGLTIPPSVDVVRVMALSGKKGKPPCLWEGVPATDQAVIDEQIAGNRRVVHWLEKNGLIQSGSATVNLQLDLFSQNKRVESLLVSDATFIVKKTKKKKKVGDEIALRAFDLTEGMVDLIKGLLAERDTIIGRLVERGLNHKEKPPVVEEPKPDIVAQFLDKGTQFMQLAKVFRELKEDR